MTKVIINGSKGRMGQALLSCGEANPDIEITAGVDVGDNLSEVIGQTDAVIEFSFHEITRSVAELCAEHKKALVIGTTGHSPEDKAGLKARLLDHVETIQHPDIKALYKRELLERFSAFAFPPKPRPPANQKRTLKGFF